MGGGMKRTIISVIMALMSITGCSTAMKVDNKLAATLLQMDMNMNPNCRAGLAAGVSSASKIDPELSLALTALHKYADANTSEYKRCYTDGAWITFAAHGSADLMKKAIAELTTLPLKAGATPVK
jgi:hypothetical protein